MSARLRKALRALRSDIESRELELRRLREAANSIAETLELDPPYKDARAVRADEFATVSSPSGAARRLFRIRGREAGSMRLGDVYETLLAGGYSFGRALDRSKRIRGLAIAMGKDNQIRKLPNGSYGLTEWYVTDEPGFEKIVRSKPVKMKVTESGNVVQTRDEGPEVDYPDDDIPF